MTTNPQKILDVRRLLLVIGIMFLFVGYGCTGRERKYNVPIIFNISDTNNTPQNTYDCVVRGQEELQRYIDGGNDPRCRDVPFGYTCEKLPVGFDLISMECKDKICTCYG